MNTQTVSPYQDCLDYIHNFWQRLTNTHRQDEGIIIGLPQPFVSPSEGIFQGDQFYWDSYFIILGLVLDKKLMPLAQGMVDNLVYLWQRFKIIPSRNRFYNTGISQPPLLTSMMWEVFAQTGDKVWLKKVAAVAAQEYEYYWLFDGSDQQRAEVHNVYRGLSRYCDHYLTHATAEHESGWDMTSRFSGQCLNFLPIDLNCLLYRYEIDLARAYELLGEQEEADRFSAAAKRRQAMMMELMWDEVSGFFFDYNYVEQRRSSVWSLAGFFPLWANLASPNQAEHVRQQLKQFEFAGGLATTRRPTTPTSTTTSAIASSVTQRDYPNGWANLHWIVVRGLLNYGYIDDAERITKKWLDLNAKIFRDTGKFWEAYDVVNQTVAANERYPRQSGFGWTNGVFARLAQEHK